MNILTLTAAAVLVSSTPAHAGDHGKTWNQIVDMAFAKSQKQNGGRAKSERQCFPDLRQCMTNVKFVAPDGATTTIVTFENVAGKLTARKICHDNLLGDVTSCVDFDSHVMTTSMRDGNGAWHILDEPEEQKDD